LWAAHTERELSAAVPAPADYKSAENGPFAFNDGDPAGVAVFVAKPFKDPLRGMPLLLRSTFIRRQDPLDDPG